MLNLKNKTEREEFIKNYKSWGEWKSVPELDLAFYRYAFSNGSVLIVTEYKEYKMVYKDCKPTSKQYVTNHKYCLILPDGDDYTVNSYVGDVNYRTYTLEGCSLGTAIDYMTKKRLEL